MMEGQSAIVNQPQKEVVKEEQPQGVTDEQTTQKAESQKIGDEL